MSSSKVVVEWLVKGLENVQRANRTVMDSVAAAERAASRSAANEARNRQRIAEAEAREKIRVWKKTDADVRRIQDAASREAERASREEVRRFERAEQEKNRIAMHWVRRREQEERQAARSRARFASAIVGAAGQGAGRIGGFAARTAGVVSQLGGGFSIADSVQQGVALKGKLADIASRDVAALGPGKTPRKPTEEIEGKVRGVSAEFGISADVGADALDKFASKTGKLKVGMDMLRGLGELSRAGVGSLDDLADAAGDIFNADQTQSAEDVLAKLRGFAVQGAQGSVEMKDMAAQLGRITAAAGRFEGGVGREMATFGALAQLAKESGGAASPREAMHAVSSLADQFGKNARLKGMQALGVDPKTSEGFNRPVEDVLMDVMLGAEKASRKKGHGLHDFDQLFGSAIGDARAQKATNPLTKAFKAAGGGEAGIKAAREQLAKFGAGGRDLKSEFATTARARTSEADAQMEIIKQKFDEAVSTRLIPAFLKLVPEFEKLVPMLVELNAKAVPAFVDLLKSVAGWAEANKGIINGIAAHPFAALIAASLTKAVGSSVITEAVKMTLTRVIGGASAGGAGGATSGSGLAAAAGTGLALGAVTSGVITAAGVGNADGEEVSQNIAAKVRAYARGDRSDRAMSPEQAQRQVDAARGRLATGLNDTSLSGGLSVMKNLAMSPFDDQASKTYHQYKVDQNVVDNASIKKAISDAITAGATESASKLSNDNRTLPIVKRATQ